MKAKATLQRATADSWKRQPFVPDVPLPYSAEFDAGQLELLSSGLVPRAMEDKWFVYFEAPYLFWHRSWTGQPVYRVELQVTGDGARVQQALLAAGGDGAGSGVDYQAKLLDFLISNLLLRQSKPFPMPPGLPDSAAAVFQHHVSGTGYREEPSKS